MHKENIAWGSMRMCKHFGLEKSLYLYPLIEPDMWDKICYRMRGGSP